MDTCKRMWSENQIGEIAKKNAAPAKLYMHFISIITGDPDYDRGSCKTVFYSYNSTPVTNYLQLDQRIGEVGVDWYLPINGDVAKQVNGVWSIIGTTTLYESNGIINYFEQANPTKTGFVSLRDTMHEFYDDVYEVR